MNTDNERAFDEEMKALENFGIDLNINGYVSKARIVEGIRHRLYAAYQAAIAHERGKVKEPSDVVEIINQIYEAAEKAFCSPKTGQRNSKIMDLCTSAKAALSAMPQMPSEDEAAIEMAEAICDEAEHNGDIDEIPYRDAKILCRAAYRALLKHMRGE